jgi:hypothetical protein
MTIQGLFNKRNQILESVLLAFKMSENCHFQIKWLIDNPEYKKMVGCGK